MHLVALALAALLFQAAAVQAQTRPSITSDGTMGSTITQTGNAYGVGGGTIQGNNLFHSFGVFNVPMGGSATFTGPRSIANVVNRVTGGQRSTIDGLIHSSTSMPTANFFLINPSGVVFGSGARVEVGGAVHVSTADYLRFADGTKFFADLSKESVLSVEQPAAFGFLSSTPAPISVQGSRLQAGLPANPGKTLSLVGGDVQITGSVPLAITLGASGGQIRIVSVGPPVPGQEGVVTLSPDVNVSSFARLGQIDISKGARIDAGGARGGTVSIRGGRLIADNSSLLADTTGSLPGAQLGIDLKVEGDIILRNPSPVVARPSVGTRSSGTGRAGNIEVEARNGSVSVTGGASIGSDSLFTAQAGNVTVRAMDDVVLSGAFTRGRDLVGSSISSLSFLRNVSAGEILVAARRVTVMDHAEIESGRIGTQGGNVTVAAKDSVVIAGGSEITSRAFSRDVGFVDISVPDGTLRMDNGSINAITRNIGNAGSISVNARDVTLSHGSAINSGSLLSATPGRGGKVSITADSLAISGGSGIFSNAEGRGRGGSIEVRAAQLQLTDLATISAKSTGTATALAGDVNIVVGNTFRMVRSAIVTDAGVADGGSISLTTGGLVYLLKSGITTSVAAGKGKGGNITIDPQFVVLDHSGIRADAAGGPGGNINIRSDFFLTNASVLSASSALSTQGTITVQSRFTDVSSSVAPLPAGLAQAATLLRASCAARVAAGKASSLVIAGRESRPPKPGRYMPSPLTTLEPGDVGSSGADVPHIDALPRLSLSVFSPACSR